MMKFASMNLKKSIKRASGFTLMEVLVSLALFTLCTVFLMQAFNLGFASITDLDTLNLAYYLAQNKLEQLRSVAYLTIVNESPTAIPGFPEYQSQVAVSFPQIFNGVPNANLKKVIVTVTFPGKGGGTRNVWLKTLIVNN